MPNGSTGGGIKSIENPEIIKNRVRQLANSISRFKIEFANWRTRFRDLSIFQIFIMWLMMAPRWHSTQPFMASIASCIASYGRILPSICTPHGIYGSPNASYKASCYDTLKATYMAKASCACIPCPLDLLGPPCCSAAWAGKRRSPP